MPQEEPVLAQAPLLQMVCRAALRAGIPKVSQEVHTFLAAAVQVHLGSILEKAARVRMQRADVFK